jgi:hypothetical protein
MPIIDRAGEGGAFNPVDDEEFSEWREDAVEQGCATPSGDREDFVVD